MRMRWRSPRRECISDRAYHNREDLARDVVRVLREELHFLLAAVVALVQSDAPVLTEVVYGTPGEGAGRSCAAPSVSVAAPPRNWPSPATFSRTSWRAPRPTVLPCIVCRGNWTPDEDVALAGDYRPLLPVLAAVDFGTYVLELCTSRAGEMEVLADLARRPPHRCRRHQPETPGRRVGRR
ncbi:MAG: 5-methyltetrahydropteroyltriglutamate--homocysteine methyltransferase [Acidimicrobiaceae bacterium]|nr:5-methyltetrahydropteroyltriglutamate--homocysteine methyltransferase [Acidimicrobiaceae bacterium]